MTTTPERRGFRPQAGSGGGGSSAARAGAWCRWSEPLRAAVALVAAFAGGALAVDADAAEPPTNPLLRIEARMHTAPIRDIAVNADSDLVVTVSDDKTARIWSLADGTLRETIRVPVGTKAEGALHAVALAPDLSTAIMTGTTGIEWDGKPSLYFARPSEAKLIGRVPGLPVTILKAAFTPDGSRFVLGLDGKNGVAVFDARTAKFLGQERTGYRGWVTGLDVAANGAVVTSSSGGSVRLYDRALKRVAVYDTPGKAMPGAVAFSPDGAEIAVAYRDRVTIDILSASDLTPRHTTVAPVGQTASKGSGYASVAWSTEGREMALFAGGTVQNGDGRSVIRRWSKAGRGRIRDIPVSDDTVTALRAVPAGGVVYGTADPLWGRLDHRGDRVFAKAQVTIDFRRAFERGFGVAQDGEIVTLPSSDPETLLRFDLVRMRLDKIPVREAMLTDQSAQAPATVADWRNGKRPTVGGQPIDLDTAEFARSAASGGSGATVFLGGDFGLRWLRRDGRQRAAIDTPGAVWAMAGTPQRDDLVVAALGDGTIRWYATDKIGRARELIALFPHADGERWIAWTPEGFFAHAGAGSQDLVGYAINNGKAKSPTWVTFTQLYRLYHRPELVRGQLGPDGPRYAAEALQAIGDLKTRLADAPPPNVEIVAYCLVESGPTRGFTRVVESQSTVSATENCSPVTAATRGFARVAPGGQSGSGGGTAPAGETIVLPEGTKAVKLRLQVRDEGGGVGDVDVFLNGRNAGRHDTRGFARVGAAVPTGAGAAKTPPGAAGSTGPLVFDQIVPVDPQDNLFVIRAYNTSGIFGESRPLRLALPEPPPIDERTLYVVAAGVNDYTGGVTPLRYAVADATAFADAIEGMRDPERYDRTVIRRLPDGQATSASIRSAIEAIGEEAGPEDSFMLYLAGHGVIADDGLYYFATSDVTGFDNLTTAGLSHLELVRLLGLVRAQNVFIFLDTCHAGKFNFDGQANLANETGRLMLAASTSVQAALDSYNQQNGVFAFAVLEGLNGEAADRKGRVDADGLGKHVRNRVSDLAGSRGHEQAAEFRTSAGSVADFPITKVTLPN